MAGETICAARLGRIARSPCGAGAGGRLVRSEHSPNDERRDDAANTARAGEAGANGSPQETARLLHELADAQVRICKMLDVHRQELERLVAWSEKIVREIRSAAECVALKSGGDEAAGAGAEDYAAALTTPPVQPGRESRVRMVRRVRRRLKV